MNKKFIPTFLLSLVLLLTSLSICPTYVNAAETTTSNNTKEAANAFERGTSNLNDTVKNSAKFGDQLIHPEKGWKRYDDTNSNLLYSYGNDVKSASWSYDSPALKNTRAGIKYNRTAHENNSSNASLKFNFTGTKIRIIATKAKGLSPDISIKINDENGKCEYLSSYSCAPVKEEKDKSRKEMCIRFEKLDLTPGRHTITITNNTTTKENKYMDIDAIDIGDTCELEQYSMDAYEGNLNSDNTTKNEFKVGNVLTKPEDGWRRYDDFNKYIDYDNTWIYRYLDYNNNTDAKARKYNNTDHLSIDHKNATVKLKFKGSKLRIISLMHYNTGADISITIDNNDPIKTNVPTSNANKIPNQAQSIIYENLNLNNNNSSDSTHTVTITNTSGKFFTLDAIDIDGELLPFKDELLSITSTNGITKKYALTKNEFDKFNKWYKENNGKGQIPYKFEKTLDGKTYNEYIVFDKIESYSVDKYDEDTTDLDDTDEDDNKISQSDKKLSITLVSGKTKSYDVSNDEANKFLEWFKANNGKGQVQYSFSKDADNADYKEYITFDKISSFKIN